MNQHISSMLEHFTSLRRKNSESAQASSNDKHNVAATEIDQKDVSDVETMSSKTRSIFKDLMSENGATNILQNLSFIKCATTTAGTTTATTAAVSSPSSSSSSNGTCKKQQMSHLHSGDSNNNRNFLLPTAIEPDNVQQSLSNGKKRNSISVVTANGTCDLNILREISPPPQRMHRKSAHDIRLWRNHDGENQGKVAAVRPLKTKNIITKNESLDSLHYRGMDVST
jgi:hypothetical protein